jgi:hypothetical protein
MSLLAIAEPLALLAIQAGNINAPTEERGASTATNLEADQRSVDIGEPVPIVFARWRNDAGGILVSPGATEARFENDNQNNVTAYYHLVVSEGQIDPIPVKDVFQQACRVGSHAQTYNRRAGTWEPGNYTRQVGSYQRPAASYHCGSIGQYPNMSTVSFQVQVPNGFDQWKRQVHLFIRGGMHVTRLYDSTTGPSDNFADLVYWMLSNSGRVPSTLIDTTSLAAAATFLEVNGLTCNCWLTESRNYADLISSWAPLFLLAQSNVDGKRGLRPLLPVNGDGTINTGAIDWEYVFTEDTILPGTFEIDYATYATRQPFVAQIIWRQELGDDAAVIRTSEVRISGTAETGPYESHDLSAFCTSEDHAIKVGAYILLRRRYVSHTVRFTARPQAHNRILSAGDIVRVKLSRQASGEAASVHDYLYQVERVTKTLAGDVSYECSHFPIDDQGRSIVALGVNNAQGTGYLFTSNRTGITCDDGNRKDDTTPPPDEGTPPEGGGGGGGDEWPTDDDGNRVPWPTDDAGDPFPWPMGDDGEPAPWPTDDGGNPLPFDPADPSFGPFETNSDGFSDFPTDDGGYPAFPVGPDGTPSIRLNADGTPSESGIDGSRSGGSTTEIGGSESGTPEDSPGEGPSDNDGNPDDDKDRPDDEGLPGYPSEYLPPDDPRWPIDLPTSTTPGDPEWIQPFSYPENWDAQDQAVTTTFTVGYSRKNLYSYDPERFPACRLLDLVSDVDAFTVTLDGKWSWVFVAYKAPLDPCGFFREARLIAINEYGDKHVLASYQGIVSGDWHTEWTCSSVYNFA